MPGVGSSWCFSMGKGPQGRWQQAWQEESTGGGREGWGSCPQSAGLFVGSSIFNNINGHLVSGALTPRVQVHTETLILFYSFEIK